VEWRPTARSGSTITVYQYYGTDGSTPTPGLGPSPSQGEITALSNLLAHEMGHALGLSDDSCANGIMNSNVPDSPTVTSDECNDLDEANTVPGGPPDTQCQVQKNCDCAPDDVIWQGSPILINLGDGPYQLTGLEDAFFSISMRTAGRNRLRGRRSGHLWLLSASIATATVALTMVRNFSETTRPFPTVGRPEMDSKRFGNLTTTATERLTLEIRCGSGCCCGPIVIMMGFPSLTS
jgi:hypothetical protein